MNLRTRRLVAIVCIVVLGVAAAMPATLGGAPTAHASTWVPAPRVSSPATGPASADVPPAVLVALPLLFGTLVSVPIPQDDAARLETAPLVSVRSPRAPPTA